MKRIKLLVDAHVFDKGFQGTTSFIEGVYQELVKKENLEIYLAAYDIENLKQYFSDPRFQFIPLKSKNRYQRLLFEFPSIIKRHQIDYAHFQYIVPPIKHCRYIVTIHDLLFKDFPENFSPAYRLQKDFLFKGAVRKADILTTVSNYSASSLERHYKVAREKILITPNAVPSLFFRHVDKAQSRSMIWDEHKITNFILYVARIEPRKNHELLIRAFRDLQWYQKDLHLVFIGQKSLPTPELDSLLAEIPQELNMRIHRFENIPPEEMLHWYNAASLFVFPSKAEGFGIPPLEAAALKTPVLCSGTTAMKDFDFFGESIFDPSDETGFKSKLEVMLNRPPNVDSLSAISREVADRYNWKIGASILFKAITK